MQTRYCCRVLPLLFVCSGNAIRVCRCAACCLLLFVRHTAVLKYQILGNWAAGRCGGIRLFDCSLCPCGLFGRVRPLLQVAIGILRDHTADNKLTPVCKQELLLAVLAMVESKGEFLLHTGDVYRLTPIITFRIICYELLKPKKRRCSLLAATRTSSTGAES